MGLPHVNCSFFLARWHFNFCSLTVEWLNTAFDSSVDPVLFLFLSTHTKKGATLSGQSAPRPSIQGALPDTQEPLHQPTVWSSRACPEEGVSVVSVFGFQTILKACVLCKRRHCVKPSVSYPVTAWCWGISIILWELSRKVPTGQLTQIMTSFRKKNSSRTNRKWSLSIKYSHWESTVSLLVQSSEFKTKKSVLAHCDLKIKSNEMSLQFRLAEHWGRSAEFQLILTAFSLTTSKVLSGVGNETKGRFQISY